jgi:hypothetical protein
MLGWEAFFTANESGAISFLIPGLATALNINLMGWIFYLI